MKSRTLTIVVTALVTAVVTSAVWVLGIAIAYRYFISEPPPFAVQVDRPGEVKLGETVELRVKVSNPTQADLELGSIDVYDSLLEGFTLVETEPTPTEKSHVLDFSSFYFSRVISPGKTLEVIFRLKAAKAGTWTGDIDCCTPGEKFVTTSVTMLVRDGQRQEPGETRPAQEQDERAPPKQAARERTYRGGA